MMDYKVVHGDCIEEMAKLPDNSMDAIVTDPPYHLYSIVQRFGKEGSAPAQYGKDGVFQRATKGFMGKEWDGGDISYRPDTWAACLRVLKPGGHILAFGGSRTFHRIAVAIEDAGFELRDTVMWVYAQGFPKSHNLKDEWQGWGTALKPAFEPIILARKPLEGTVAANVLKWGTGAINIDGCRVGTRTANESGWSKTGSKGGENRAMAGPNYEREPKDEAGTGRWPANFIHDGSEEVLELMPETKSGTAIRHNSGGNTFGGENPKPLLDDMGYGDGGSAARYFYCAKASKQDRDEGCEGLDERPAFDNPNGNMGTNMGSRSGPRRNNHPTVKPTSLMRYLCRLITPPGGTILDPFMGSGSTGKAAILEGFNFIGIEREAEYVEIATSRLEWAKTHMPACGMADCTDITNDQTLF